MNPHTRAQRVVLSDGAGGAIFLSLPWMVAKSCITLVDFACESWDVYYPHRIQSYGRLMLTFGVTVDGECYHI